MVEIKDVENTTIMKHRTAGFWVRFLAYTIDIISLSAIGAILLGLVHQFISLPTNIVSWIGISFATIGLIGFVYFTVMTRFWAQTLGKMIMGIQVIRKNGAELDWSTVLVREIPGRTISQLLGAHLGYLWVAFHPDKLSWHDLFCDTYVVHVNELEGRRWINVNGK